MVDRDTSKEEEEEGGGGGRRTIAPSTASLAIGGEGERLAGKEGVQTRKLA
jgi:hypothetical protein